MKISKTRIIGILATLAVLITSCGKGFLDVKRNVSQVVPKTIADYQAILDWNTVMNRSSSHILPFISADEYTVSDEIWNATSGTNRYEKNAYIWAKDIFEDTESPDWNNAYQRIMYANQALDVMNIQPAESEKPVWNNVVGSALFHRAYAFYQLVQLFCKPYSPGKAVTELGLPLRLDYDVSVKIGRSSLEESYNCIITDLTKASELLPLNASTEFRPIKSAAYALLARTFLNMRDFTQAKKYADMALQLNGQLLNFKDLIFSFNSTSSSPFPLYAKGNKEVIFACVPSTAYLQSSSRFDASTEILGMFEKGDLRKKLFYAYNGRTLYMGSYWGNGHINPFTGLATDELYLIRAECRARLGDTEGAMTDINYLLSFRYDSSFIPLESTSAEQALTQILTERRKELYLRGLRWEDLRRLNLEERFSKTISRTIAGTTYELPPNDPRWVMPIPNTETQTSGIDQNMR